MRRFLPMLTLLILSGVTQAQVRYQQGRRVVAQRPQTGVAAVTADWAKQLIKTEKVDFGVIATGSDSKKFLRVTNTLDKPVNIRSATTTCGCSVATPSKRYLLPGEEAMIEVTMNTRRFKRRKDSNVIVVFDQPAYTEMRIPITAYIRTDVVFEPGMVQFGNVELSKGKTLKVKVAYAGRPDWAIKSLQVRNPYLAAKATELKREAGRIDYQIEILLKDSTPVGRLRDLITLVTDDKANPFVPLLVEANVEPDIGITPGTVPLGLARAGQALQSRVVVKGKVPFEIEKVESKSGMEGFQYRRPMGNRQVHVLMFSLKPGTAISGKFEEEFSVWIKGRPEPVTFKATGEVAAAPNARLGSAR